MKFLVSVVLAAAVMGVVIVISKWLADRDTERMTREIEESSKKFLEYWRESRKKKGNP